MDRPYPERSRRRFLGAAAALGAGALCATVPARGGLAAPGTTLLPPGDWTLDPDRSDEFDGDTLDLDKWGTDHWNMKVRSVQFDPGNVTVSGGKLRLALTDNPDYPGEGERRYLSGNVRSTFTIPGNSYTEVRARMIPRAVNANSAIWLHQEATVQGNPNVEIDMQEYLLPPDAGPDNVRSALHLWHKDPEHPDDNATREDLGRTIERVDGLDRSFHWYGLERRGDDVLRFYIDGVEYWAPDAVADNPSLATQPQPIILYVRDINESTPINPAAVPAEFVVDYVRVYTL